MAGEARDLRGVVSPASPTSPLDASSRAGRRTAQARPPAFVAPLSAPRPGASPQTRIAHGTKFGHLALPKVLAAAEKLGLKASKLSAARVTVEARSPLYPHFTGKRKHRDPAFGSRGGNRTHEHTHTATARTPTTTPQSMRDEDDAPLTMATPFPSLPDDSVEARIAILRARAVPDLTTPTDAASSP